MTDIQILKHFYLIHGEKSFEVQTDNPWVKRMVAAGYAELKPTFCGPTKEYIGDLHFKITPLGIKQLS